MRIREEHIAAGAVWTFCAVICLMALLSGCATVEKAYSTVKRMTCAKHQLVKVGTETVCNKCGQRFSTK